MDNSSTMRASLDESQQSVKIEAPQNSVSNLKSIFEQKIVNLPSIEKTDYRSKHRNRRSRPRQHSKCQKCIREQVSWLTVMTKV